MSTIYHIENEGKQPITANIKDRVFAIAVSEWNYNITGALLQGAIDTLKNCGANEDNIIVRHVPGSFELTYAAAAFLKNKTIDAVIVLGSVVRGDTPHFDYVCQGVTQGIAQLNAQGQIPVIFGVLTTDNMQQAEDRAGGSLGNKGSECAETAIKMLEFACSL